MTDYLKQIDCRLAGLKVKGKGFEIDQRQTPAFRVSAVLHMNLYMLLLGSTVDELFYILSYKCSVVCVDCYGLLFLFPAVCHIDTLGLAD